jgi:hypothetical protein
VLPGKFESRREISNGTRRRANFCESQKSGAGRKYNTPPWQENLLLQETLDAPHLNPLYVVDQT